MQYPQYFPVLFLDFSYSRLSVKLRDFGCGKRHKKFGSQEKNSNVDLHFLVYPIPNKLNSAKYFETK